MLQLPKNSTCNRFLFIFMLLLLSFFSGCEKLAFFRTPLSRPFSHKFITERTISHHSYFYDLDQDGQDEYIEMDNKYYEKAGRSYIKIYNNNFGLAQQVNVNGTLQQPHAFNWNGDGNLEIALLYTRNDSLLICLANKKGEKLVEEAFLFSGKSIWNEHGNYRWEGTIRDLKWADLNSDGSYELILFPSAGHTLRPRGVYIFDGRTFTEIWHFESGPPPTDTPALIDCNRNGFLDIIFSTSAPDNGNVVNGTRDDESYLFQINYKSKRVFKKKYGNIFSGLNIIPLDIDGDRKSEVALFFHHHNQKEAPHRLEFWEPIKKEVSLSREFLFDISGFTPVQIDRTIEKEFLITNTEGELLLLDHKFNDLLNKKYKTSFGTVSTCEDLDNDGFEEIFVGSEDGLFLFDNKLSIKSFIPKTMQSTDFSKIKLFHRQGKKPLIAFFNEKSGVLASLE